jgi:hypothetical protein
MMYLSASLSYIAIGSPDSSNPNKVDKLDGGEAAVPSKLKNLKDEFHEAT